MIPSTDGAPKSSRNQVDPYIGLYMGLISRFDISA